MEHPNTYESHCITSTQLFLSEVSVNLISIMEISKSEKLRFPPNFTFGAATASYQVEGAWNKDGKGEQIWDRTLHDHPEWVRDKSNGDIACNSYELYKEDVRLLKDLGVNMYRFSISWARILPKATVDEINEAGIRYYNNLINELLANNIQPMVTMYHWDLPQILQEIGGWTNPFLIHLFMDYANFLFQNFGDRVKWWITFNEPAHICKSYTDGTLLLAPCLELRNLGADHLCAKNILKSHAEVYHMYREKYVEKQRGKIGIALHSFWYEPKTSSTEDVKASEAALDFDLGTFAHPIFSKEGDYPKFVLETMAEKMKSTNLPYFSPMGEKWRKRIKGSADFLGLNHYTTRWVQPGTPDWWIPDLDVSLSIEDNLLGAESPWLKMVPWGLRKLLKWIKRSYDNPLVIITENGFSDKGEINDEKRMLYITKYLQEILKAIHEDGCHVIGYTVWSLLDNFEWLQGYREKFGLYQVDFADPERPRRPKSSTVMIKQIIEQREVPDEEDLKNIKLS